MTCEMDALEFVSDRVHFLDKDSSTFLESAPTKSFLKAPSTAYVKQSAIGANMMLNFWFWFPQVRETKNFPAWSFRFCIYLCLENEQCCTHVRAVVA